MSTSPITPQPPATGGTTTGTSSSGLPSSQSLNNMFLQLLVAQLQNQDPTDPLDPSQFVGQLAQFSELSEVTQIYQLLQSFAPASSGGTASSNAVAANGTAAQSNNLTNPLSPSPPAAILSPAAPASNFPSSFLPAMSSSSLPPPAVSAAQSAISGFSSLAPPASTPSPTSNRIEGVF